MPNIGPECWKTLKRRVEELESELAAAHVCVTERDQLVIDKQKLESELGELRNTNFQIIHKHEDCASCKDHYQKDNDRLKQELAALKDMGPVSCKQCKLAFGAKECYDACELFQARKELAEEINHRQVVLVDENDRLEWWGNEIFTLLEMQRSGHGGLKLHVKQLQDENDRLKQELAQQRALNDDLIRKGSMTKDAIEFVQLEGVLHDTREELAALKGILERKDRSLGILREQFQETFRELAALKEKMQPIINYEPIKKLLDLSIDGRPLVTPAGAVITAFENLEKELAALKEKYMDALATIRTNLVTRTPTIEEQSFKELKQELAISIRGHEQDTKKHVEEIRLLRQELAELKLVASGKLTTVHEGHEIEKLQQEIAAARAERNTSYSERAFLVSVIASAFPSSLEQALDCKDDPDFNWIVYVDTPAGQASWHIAETDLHYFRNIPRDEGRKWDGHNNTTKMLRLDGVKDNLAWSAAQRTKALAIISKCNASCDIPRMIPEGCYGAGCLEKVRGVLEGKPVGTCAYPGTHRSCEYLFGDHECTKQVDDCEFSYPRDASTSFPLSSPDIKPPSGTEQHETTTGLVSPGKTEFVELDEKTLNFEIPDDGEKEVPEISTTTTQVIQMNDGRMYLDVTDYIQADPAPMDWQKSENLHCFNTLTGNTCSCNRCKGYDPKVHPNPEKGGET
jgi:hypothetical protein